LTTRRVGKTNLGRRRRERLSRSWSRLAGLMKLALEVAYAVFLLLDEAQLVLILAGHPLVIIVEAVEMGVSAPEAGLKLTLLHSVRVLEEKQAPTMGLLKVDHLLLLHLVRVTAEVAHKRIFSGILDVHEDDDCDVERANEDHLASRDQVVLAKW
jgi:hypothetical protein